MNAVNMSWRTETGRLACRWAEAGDWVEYNPPWMTDAHKRDAEKSAERTRSDYSRISPLGAEHWYVRERLQ